MESTREDEEYTLYYIESNNVKNYSINEILILSGLAYKGENKDYDVDKLSINLNGLSDSQDFIDTISSEKVNLLLKWLLENDIYIHYCNMNSLYFAIDDISDSILQFSGSEMFIAIIKDIFYRYAKADLDVFNELLNRFSYPHIKKCQCMEFCTLLIEWVEKLRIHYNNENDDFMLRVIKQFAEGSMERNKSVFSESSDEELLKDCYEALHKYQSTASSDGSLKNLSAVMVELLRRFFEFINKSNKKENMDIVDGLSNIQVENIVLLFRLIIKSEDENSGFIENLWCLQDDGKYGALKVLSNNKYNKIKVENNLFKGEM